MKHFYQFYVPVLRRLVLTGFALLCLSPALIAQDASAPPVSSTPDPVTPEALASPRATLNTFRTAMRAYSDGDSAAISGAISALDLSHVNPLVRPEKGIEAATLLHEIMQRSEVKEPPPIRDPAAGETYTWNRYDAGVIELEFTPAAGWRFTAASVERLPAILDELIAVKAAIGESAELESLPLPLQLRARIPKDLRGTALVLERWQWIGIGLIILFGFILDRLVAALLQIGVRIWRNRFAAGAFRDIEDSILRPLGLMAMALLWWAGLNVLGLPAGVLLVLLISVKFLACLSAVWGAYRLVDLVGVFLRNRASATASKLDDALIPLVTKTFKVLVTVMGVVFIADNLDIDVSSLIAGLGLGGLAFALAAKDVAGNLFGSVTVLLDQTFTVGDWVVIGDVEGTVERIGFRSTRIRTFYNSLVSVPNSALITANVDNMGARAYRRLSCKFGIAYDTSPERIESFCEGIRELVREHPYMRKDNFHVYLNGLGAASLDILVYVFWRTPDWATELRERHRFLLDCLRLAERLGVEYAFPTQTIHLRQGEQEPLPVPEEPFSPAVDSRTARERGRDEARAIVDATLGRGTVPPPVGSANGDDVDG